MWFGYFTLFVALVISAIAAYYSIIGLTAIFSAAVIPIMIMGASLEIGKVTAAVWLKMYWERASLMYKFYLVPAVAFLMLLTSMGIFGFLSKAHSDQSLVSGDSMARVAIYDEKIKISKENIDANRRALKQMDESVDQVMGRSSDEKGADKAVAIRRGQQKERVRLQSEIEVEQKKIGVLNEERAPLAAENRKIESEVGPIKYIAALVYGDNPDQNVLEKAVRLVIIIIVLVFDPLALVLILAAQQSIRWAREERDADKASEIVTQQVVNDLELPVPEPAEPELSFWEKHAYLLKPFVHFKNTLPMVFRPEKAQHTIMEDTAAMAIVPPDETANVTVQPFTEQEIDALNAYNDERLVSKFDKQQMLTAGIDDIERPGDYITPDDDDGVSAAEKEAMKRWKADNPDDTLKRHRLLLVHGKIAQVPWLDPRYYWPETPNLGLEADNELGEGPITGFGSSFPMYPNKGDKFLRVDRLPSALYKYNGRIWIEIDKNLTDDYAYDENYIDHLIQKLASGEYDPDLLSAAEQEQIEYRLNNKS